MLAHVLSRIVRASEIGRVGLQIASHLPILNILHRLDTLIEQAEWASRYGLAGRRHAMGYGHGFAARAVEGCSRDIRSGLRRPAIAVRC